LTFPLNEYMYSLILDLMHNARRRYYRLTNLGSRVLAAESDRLEYLVRVIRAKRRMVAREAES
jgi:hypothetical protein